MRIHVHTTAQLGELVVAAFDGAAHYSTDPLEVSRLAAAAVSLMLRRTRREAILPLRRTTSTKAADLSQSP